MDKLYPEDAAAGEKFGGQTFSDPNYTPRELDSVQAATARMLEYMETTGVDQPGAVAAGLSGSDEAGTVTKLYESIMAERKQLLGLDRSAADYETKVAATAKTLDSAKWLAARPKTVAVIEKL
jgi:hypothetical protein